MDWDVIFKDVRSVCDFNACIAIFYENLNSIISKCVPKSKVKISTAPVWYTPELKSLKNKKNKAFKKFKQYNSSYDFSTYTKLRYEFSVMNTKCYNDYLNKVKNEINIDSKKFYNFVNTKRKTSEYPTNLKFNDKMSDIDSDISEFFSDFFKSIYSTETFDENCEYPYDIQPFDFSQPIIDPETVLKYIKSLKSCSKPGPDLIPSCFLINCCENIYIPLYILFSLSLKFGYVPDIWKSSYIIPLHKSGSRNDVTNYRGIAKLSVIPKLFEHIVSDQLSLSITNYISTKQHGFLKGRSIVTNLLEFTTKIMDSFNNGFQTDVIYTDFSKAFDTVNHTLLIKKLSLLGFPPSLVKWLESYLINRSQSVLFRNSLSKSVIVGSGVPQGSHLGPLLFNLFINDLPFSISFSSILMYADDVKIFLPISDQFSHIQLQEDLDSLGRWCSFNLMSLNLKKCKVMSFYRRSLIQFNYFLLNVQLDSMTSFVDLGVTMDPKLSFINHINNTISKARSVLGFIKRWAKEFNDPYITKTLFIALVRPILEFGSCIWCPYYETHINHLESVQKQFLLFALKSFNWDPTVNLPSYENRLKLLNLPTLKSRRILLNISFLHKLISGEVSSTFLLGRIEFNVPLRSLRSFYPIRICSFSSHYLNFQPFLQICKDYNDFYSLVDFSVSIFLIKKQILEILCS